MTNEQEELVDKFFKEIQENFRNLKFILDVSGLRISSDFIDEVDNLTSCAWRNVREEAKLKENN